MNEQIKLIISLQSIDTNIANFNTKKNEIEKIIDEQLQKTNKSKNYYDETKKKFFELEKEKHHKEVEVKSLEEEIKKILKQLSDIKTNKEYSALQQEINHRKEKKENLETEIILCFDKEDFLKKETNDSKKKLEEEIKKIEKNKNELEEKIKEIEKNIIKEQENKKNFALKVEKNLFNRYETIINNPNKNSLAITIIKEGFCQGCFVFLPPQKINEIKTNKNIISCESCGRFLYYDE
ncbi:MAG: C4-type zinc ribbon domain-containing protein [bacterium]